MKLRWLGTAGFEFQTDAEHFLVDPYLSRNKIAVPTQDLSPEDFKTTTPIFISHGHFDHLWDVKKNLSDSGGHIYCSQTIKKNLLRNKNIINKVKSVSDKQKFEFNSFTATAFFSSHIRFDLKLIFSTLLRMKTQVFKIHSLFKDYPCGQVLSWRFETENTSIQHFGSAGSTKKELKLLSKKRLDILLVPLQGHSKICEIAYKYVRILKPRMVIPHHFDNFYPPLSQTVDIQPFVEKVRQKRPKTEIKVPRLNQWIQI